MTEFDNQIDDIDDSDDDDVDFDDELDEHVEAQPVAKSHVTMSTLPVTGEPRVDDALSRLQDITALPVSEHVPVYDDVRRRLHDTLSDLSGQ